MSSTNQRPILISAIEALAEELPSGKRRSEMRQLASSLHDSTTINDSEFDQRSKSWLPMFAHSLATPAAATRLSEWMNRAARENEIRSRRRRVVLYPIVVFGFATLVFFGLSQMVVSPFIEMYNEFGLQLPAPTEFLFFWVKQWQDHTIRFVSITVSVVLTGYLLAKFWIEHALTTRLFGYLAGGTTGNVAAMASFTGLLADFVANDVPLDESLELAGRGCGHRHFAHVAMSLADQHRRYNVALAQSPLAKCFPRNVIDALQPSDGSPPQGRLLRELSTIYAERAVQRTEWATGLVGAVAVFMVGLVVAFVVISLFMPLVSLVSGLT
jgi:type IV pilus assembly protein PilC